nr:hypothetical protein [Propioniciclava sp. MC1595]
MSSSSASARPSTTSTSFHARLAASRTPAHMPWPMKGGVWWQASPARNTRPFAQPRATTEWKV